MTAAVTVALVGAGAALLGGLVTAFATRRVEVLRLRANLLEKADERRLAALEQFMLAVNGWLDWLVYIEDQGRHQSREGLSQLFEELNRRVKARDDAYRRLMMLASDSLFAWLMNTYNPLEYKLKETYVRRVRYGQPITDDARRLRQAFSRLLRVDLIEQFRPEVEVLRDPLHAQQLRQGVWRLTRHARGAQTPAAAGFAGTREDMAAESALGNPEEQEKLSESDCEEVPGHLFWGQLVLCCSCDGLMTGL